MKYDNKMKANRKDKNLTQFIVCYSKIYVYIHRISKKCVRSFHYTIVTTIIIAKNLKKKYFFLQLTSELILRQFQM